jgi:hypothetical protein
LEMRRLQRRAKRQQKPRQKPLPPVHFSLA